MRMTDLTNVAMEIHAQDRTVARTVAEEWRRHFVDELGGPDYIEVTETRRAWRQSGHPKKPVALRISWEVTYHDGRD